LTELGEGLGLKRQRPLLHARGRESPRKELAKHTPVCSGIDPVARCDPKAASAAHEALNQRQPLLIERSVCQHEHVRPNDGALGKVLRVEGFDRKGTSNTGGNAERVTQECGFPLAWVGVRVAVDEQNVNGIGPQQNSPDVVGGEHIIRIELELDDRVR
jgi:hypothetical protein